VGELENKLVIVVDPVLQLSEDSAPLFLLRGQDAEDWLQSLVVQLAL